MPIDVSVWRRNICDGVHGVASEQFQRENWFGGGKYVASYEEVFNELFDDFAIESFLASPEVALTAEQVAAGKALIEELEAFDREVGPNAGEDLVIDHPRWADVRRVAQRFGDLLGCKW
jgi:hypothetical protein